ncbi:phosphate acetyltransferase [Corynebacterium sp. ES2794-CONJ1]|uniref:phosphate acetyltransferase n=1 Tax=unclassified Corynebacterium TaxID=2624378 RepID=UPI002166E531|nr:MULTISPECIES: phosphate acetyltransferase [unclassified Corynebacterium]MCS4490211.1 phosphate acetyltransferase [Corynebacterium sp. ES2775-CONJ]MCS4491978.1 phosphate acetyltransferase [Corynebacterium sp. ES2715-CONJ3]MCS4532082.1 phosphate acetyltransferase [Corynebacterium sp. ES2730-CONJ]MCU9519484.1 phosphate acetyltransferase [Corynebacterium sp. ES2794-CONJ1]
MTHTTRSVVISALGRQIDTADLEHFAQILGLDIQPLVVADPTITGVLSTRPESPVVYQGTGSIDFDARAAAALGVPLIIQAAELGVSAELARAEAKVLGAHIVDILGPGSSLESALPALHEAQVEPVMSAEVFEFWLLDRARQARAHIILPEGDDDRILLAADQLLAQDICELTILGNPAAITARATELGLNISAAHLSDPSNDPHAEEFAQEFYELRKAKGMTIEKARETMQDISYYATMMIHKGLADGMVSGAAHTTAHTIKPSFQIIKTQPGTSVVSSIFLMVMRNRLWAFGDCAVNPNPTAAQLAEIAAVSARTAAQFGIDPRVAILSYSTGTSGSGPDVDRATEATRIAHQNHPDILIDGPLQFDAAVDRGVAEKKMPNSKVAGQANVFIFPDLEAGNIGYKTAQRTGHALAVGPILQGLNKPVNDLSRGATVADIVNTVAITAIQAAAL